MSFIWPTLLFSLITLVPLVALYIRMQRRRRDLIARYGSMGIVQAARRPIGWRRHLPPALFLLALALLLFSLARPQTTVSLPRVEGIVILAFDVSGSMAADDLKPTRMEAAKVAARDFVNRQPPTVQIGVVSFSDGGLSVQPPTNDQAEILAAINRLTPTRGTSLSNGILASLNAIATANGRQAPSLYTNRTPVPTAVPTAVPKGTYTPAAIVLLTDGENTAPPGPLDAAAQAADRGVRIYPVGIGSAAGAPVKIEGFVVQSRLDEATLQQIAQRTDGVYYNAVSEDQLQKVYQSLGSQLVVRPERTEVTALFAGAGLLVLLLGGTFSFFWFGRIP
ncbi:MAG TPA: VWA domain-containing protein [Thermomicrobiales bacterium]|jgi:Ca-activated chloride channel family protein